MHTQYVPGDPVTLGRYHDDGFAIEHAPKDRPILAYCDHDADPYVEDEDTGKLTLYAAHAEGVGHAPNGFHVVRWGGGWDYRSYEEPEAGYLPDWWFEDVDFELPANPVRWWPLPEQWLQWYMTAGPGRKNSMLP